jgi:hypothetical protein
MSGFNKISVDKNFKVSNIHDADIRVLDIANTNLGHQKTPFVPTASGFIPCRIVKADGTEVQACLKYFTA